MQFRGDIGPAPGDVPTGRVSPAVHRLALSLTSKPPSHDCGSSWDIDIL